jgi:peptidoglycan hydrolase CwlO-like protein
MNAHKYITDDNAEVVISSSIPGLTFVPRGMKQEDAISVSQNEYDKHIEGVILKNKDFIDPQKKQIHELTKIVGDLQNEVDKLKSKVPPAGK